MNEPGDSMYFIQNGYIKIANEDESVVFCTLMPGAYFGVGLGLGLGLE